MQEREVKLSHMVDSQNEKNCIKIRAQLYELYHLQGMSFPMGSFFWVSVLGNQFSDNEFSSCSRFRYPIYRIRVPPLCLYHFAVSVVSLRSLTSLDLWVWSRHNHHTNNPQGHLLLYLRLKNIFPLTSNSSACKYLSTSREKESYLYSSALVRPVFSRIDLSNRRRILSPGLWGGVIGRVTKIL